MGQVIIVRPGCTDYDEQHRIQGSLDLPLNPRGEEQVQEIVEQLRGTPLDVIYTADCEPARSTAWSIGEALGISVKEQDGFRNLRQGLWEGLAFEDVRRKFPKVFRQWQESPETICPPGGEPVAEAIERIREALEKPIRKKQRFAVVASEPLATLLGCLLRHCRPETPDFETTCSAAPRVEFIELNGHAPNGHQHAGPVASPEAVHKLAVNAARLEKNSHEPPVAATVAAEEPPISKGAGG